MNEDDPLIEAIDDLVNVLSAKVAEMSCPTCKVVGKMRIDLKLTAKPLGTFSLSGSQLEFSPNEIPVLHCDACGLEVEGNVGA